jgi:integrase
VIHVRRGIWNGKEITPKTETALRDVDIDDRLTQMLRTFIGERSSGRLFSARNGSPLAHGNLRQRVLTPLLKQLDIPRAGHHAFRHSRVTQLRKHGTPADLQKQWIGHTSLSTTDRYSHTDHELEYRRQAAGRVGLDRVLGPNGPKSEATEASAATPLKSTV